MGFSVSPNRQILLPVIAILSLAVPAVCQSAGAPVIPQTIKFEGIAAGQARETVEIAFRIYSSMEGGEPLWSETQSVSIGADGKYSVFLGTDAPGGLPQTIFVAGQARWLGVSIEPGAEQKRIPLISVPYAMKAADAQTLSGLPAAEFVTQGQLHEATSAAATAAAEAGVSPDAITGGGTTGALAYWMSATALGSSAIVQGGTAAAPVFGVNLGALAPTATFDVGGTVNARSGLTLNGNVKATATGGVTSPALLFTANTFSTGGTTTNQNFSWHAVPVGNDTASPTAKLVFGSGSGTTTTDTALGIAPSGVISFAAGQTFPGTGTITGITASSPLTGGGTTGSVTVGLNPSALETTLNTVYPRLSAANTFTGNQTITGNLTASGTVTGDGSNAAYGVNGSTNSTTQFAAGVSGSEGATAGQVFGVSGVAYSSTSGAAGVRGHEYATSGPVFGVLGANESSGSGAAGVAGSEHATTGLVYGVSGSTNSTGNGAAGVSGYEGATTGLVNGVAGGTPSTQGNGVNGSATATSGFANGVYGQTSSPGGNGVFGQNLSNGGNGVFGVSDGKSGNGVLGVNNATSAFAVGVTGITNSPNGAGINGFSNTATGGIGVNGNAGTNGTAILGGNQSCGSGGCIYASGTALSLSTGTGGTLIYAARGPTGSPKSTAATTEFTVDASGNGYFNGSLQAAGGSSVANTILGTTASTNGSGLFGNATATTGFANGLYAQTSSSGGNGAFAINKATSGFAVGISGVTSSPNGTGIFGSSVGTTGGTGVFGNAPANGIALYAQNQDTCPSGVCHYVAGTALSLQTGSGGTLIYAATGPAGSPKSTAATEEFSVDSSGNGFFNGNLHVKGTLSKGGGSFKIDDPLDPAHKYLSHSFVESPDMMNVYNGNVITDRHGYATVMLPEYFEALNRDFRYQLTVMGQFAQAIVAKKIAQNRFVIRTSKPGVEVSWQVTGIRQDAWANANRIPVEEEKPAVEQGHYLHPEVFGQPASKSVSAVRANSSMDGSRSGSQ